MPSSKKSVPAEEFFGDPDGICSLAVAKSAGIRYADPTAELIPLVVSGSPPAPPKAKLIMFGHQVTKANAKHHGASTQFFSAPAVLLAQLKLEILDWKSVEFDTQHLNMLRSVPVGGALALIQHWNADSE
jgi:hypothetical protein